VIKLRRGHPLGSLHGAGEGQRSGTRGGGRGAAGSGEGGRKGKGACPGGLARLAGLLRAKRPNGCWAIWAKC
jgi:hypothetical protein